MADDPKKATSEPEIRSFKFVDEMPHDDKRDPHTLYIPITLDVPLRDQTLGAFMDQWSRLENSLLMILWSLMDTSYHEAEVLFYSTVNIKTQTDMITGLMALKHPQQAARLRKLTSRCLTLSNNRNHLVHGNWLPEIVVAADDQQRPYAKRIKWARVYKTGDPDLNAKATIESDEPKTGQHRYSIDRIQKKIEQVASLAEELGAFNKRLYGSGPRSKST